MARGGLAVDSLLFLLLFLLLLTGFGREGEGCLAAIVTGHAALPGDVVSRRGGGRVQNLSHCVLHVPARGTLFAGEVFFIWQEKKKRNRRGGVIESVLCIEIMLAAGSALFRLSLFCFFLFGDVLATQADRTVSRRQLPYQNLRYSSERTD